MRNRVEQNHDSQNLGKSSAINLEDFLFKNLVDLDENRANLKKLLDNFKKYKPISFVGAGISSPLGISKWKELLKEICYLSDNKDEYIGLLGDSERYQEIAQWVYDELSSKGKEEEFFNILRRSMQQRTNSTTITLIKMILAIDDHITTNFDIAIESAYDFLGFLEGHYQVKDSKIDLHQHYIPDFNIINIKDQNIFYLHGNVRENIYVFRSSEYEHFYPSVSRIKDGNSCIEDCLKQFYKYRNIIFMGFSFSDRYIREFFQSLARKIEIDNLGTQKHYQQSGEIYEAKDLNHFLLMDESNENPNWQKWYLNFQITDETL